MYHWPCEYLNFYPKQLNLWTYYITWVIRACNVFSRIFFFYLSLSCFITGKPGLANGRSGAPKTPGVLHIIWIYIIWLTANLFKICTTWRTISTMTGPLSSILHLVAPVLYRDSTKCRFKTWTVLVCCSFAVMLCFIKCLQFFFCVFLCENLGQDSIIPIQKYCMAATNNYFYYQNIWQLFSLIINWLLPLYYVRKLFPKAQVNILWLLFFCLSNSQTNIEFTNIGN